MNKLVQVMSAVALCFAMAFSASAQRKGQQPDRGGKETRDIQREPKGDRGGGGNKPERPRGENGGNRGNGGDGGKRGNRPNELL